TILIGDNTTRVTLQRGARLPLTTPAGVRVVTRARPVSLPTRRPDLEATNDAVRCGQASASSEQAGTPALAAVDGSPATDWQLASLPATLTVPVRGGAGATVSTPALEWGQQWPPAFIGPTLPVAVTERASSYTLQASADGHT